MIQIINTNEDKIDIIVSFNDIKKRMPGIYKITLNYNPRSSVRIGSVAPKTLF